MSDKPQFEEDNWVEGEEEITKEDKENNENEENEDSEGMWVEGEESEEDDDDDKENESISQSEQSQPQNEEETKLESKVEDKTNIETIDPKLLESPQPTQVTPKNILKREKSDLSEVNLDSPKPQTDETIEETKKPNETQKEESSPQKSTPVQKTSTKPKPVKLSARSKTLISTNEELRKELFVRYSYMFKRIKEDLMGLNKPLTSTLNTAQHVSFNLRKLNEDLSILTNHIQDSLPQLNSYLKTSYPE